MRTRNKQEVSAYKMAPTIQGIDFKNKIKRGLIDPQKWESIYADGSHIVLDNDLFAGDRQRCGSFKRFPDSALAGKKLHSFFKIRLSVHAARTNTGCFRKLSA